MLEKMIVPKANRTPASPRGYWLRALDGDMLTSVHLYDTRQNADAAPAGIQEGPRPAPP
jgi:hypothetical protein